ncbi:hypothetical protein ABH905_003668 [Pseudomonas frederiksbergensis]|jgi:hypothetical protein
MKCYVFPIKDGEVYLGVKSLINPYNSRHRMWGAGFPMAFGGNDDDDNTHVTCAREASEESHWKLDLDSAIFTHLVNLESNGIPYFFYYATGFTYDPTAVLPPSLARSAAYRETTGRILTINLNERPPQFLTRGIAAAWILQRLREQHPDISIDSSAEGYSDFLSSETLRAFILLVRQHIKQPID